MKKFRACLLLVFLLSSCMPNTNNPKPSASGQTDIPSATSETAAVDDGIECIDSEMDVMAEDIANQFDFVEKEKIMEWFCEGAEFEDILVALQTEKITGHASIDLLEMIAAGFSWDEVWKSIGYITGE